MYEVWWYVRHDGRLVSTHRWWWRAKLRAAMGNFWIIGASPYHVVEKVNK